MSEEVLELPEGWAWAVLQDICQTVETILPGDRPDDEFLYIDISSIDRATQTIDSPQALLGRQAPSRARRLLREGDVLISTVRPNLRTIARVPRALDGQVASTGFCVLRPEEGIDPDFLFFSVLEESFQQRVQAKARGVSYPAVRDADVMEELVPLPPTDEQRRIVSCVNALREDISQGRRALLEADALARQLSEQLVVTLLSEAVDQQELGKLLREPLRNGHSAKASSDGRGIRTITLTAVTNGSFTDANTKMTVADPERVRGLWLEPGDILVQRSNTPELVGTAALYRGERGWAIFPDLLIRVRVDEDRLLPDYLDLVLSVRTSRDYFRGCAQGTAGSMPKIDQGVVERLEVPVVSVERQRHIVSEARRLRAETVQAAAGVDEVKSVADDLERSVLATALRGSLVPQDPLDEPAFALLERIRLASAELSRTRRGAKRTRSAGTGASS